MAWHPSRTICFLASLWEVYCRSIQVYGTFHVSVDTRKHSEDRWVVQALFDNKSQLAHRGAAATPIPAEDDSRAPENSPSFCGERAHRSPYIGFALPQRLRAPRTRQSLNRRSSGRSNAPLVFLPDIIEVPVDIFVSNTEIICYY